MSDRPGTFTPFESPTFKAVWCANIASSFGGLVQTVGAAWLMASITSSAEMVALIQASTSLPFMMLSLVAGAIADTFERRRVMLAAQAFMFTVSVTLTLFAWFDLITPWGLLTFTFLIGCGTALNNPSWQASVGDMVPKPVVPAAVVLNSVGFNITRSVGPALGGAIVAAAGAVAAFAINTVSYVGLFTVLLRWKPPVQPSTLPRETLGSAMTSGLRYVVMSPSITKVLIRGFAFGIASISMLALLPVVARDLLGGGPLLFGVLLGVFGLGAIGGGLASNRLRQRLSTEWITRGAFLGFALAVTVMAVAPNAWVAAPAAALGGAAWVLANSLFNMTVQLSTPRWVVGRALSCHQMMVFGGQAMGSWIWGRVADLHDTETALILAGLVLLVGAALGLKLVMPPHLTVNLDPANRWREPPLELNLQPRSGPISIAIEYQIRDEDLETFMALMEERRRARMRNGARHWTLMRDMEHHDRWVETYKLPTWLDYVRHNHRTTLADADLAARVRALHAGPEAPRVQRMIIRPTRHTADATHPKADFDHH